MNTEQFVSLIKRIVAEYANAHLDKSDCKESRKTMFLLCGCVKPYRTARLWRAQRFLTVCTMR